VTGCTSGATGASVVATTTVASTVTPPSTTVSGAVATTTTPPVAMPASIATGEGPCGLAAAGGRVWVSLLGEDAVTPIDPTNGEIGAEAPVPGSPCWIVGDEETLWVAPSAAGYLVRLDASTGQETRRVEIGEEPADPYLALAFGDLWATVPATGEVVRIEPSTGEVVARIPAVDDPRSIVRGGGLLWVASASSGAVAAIDPSTDRVVRSFQVPGSNVLVAYVDDAVWLGSAGDHTVTEVDPETGAVVAVYPVGGNPQPGVVAAGRLWVPNHEEHTLSVIDLVAGTVGTVAVGAFPSAVLEVDGVVWAADYGDRTVTVVPVDAALGPPPLVTPPPDWLGTRQLPVTEAGFGEVQPTPPELADRRFTTEDVLAPPEDGEFVATIDPVPDEVAARSTWHEGCPVALDDLRYVTVSFRGFDQRAHTGEIIISADYAEDVVGVFATLWDMRYPIEEMRITSAEELDLPPTGDGNNTESFVCRPATGGTSWSRHAYGRAIDVNPFHNPYHRGDVVLPELASAYLDRDRNLPGMIAPGDPVVEAFAAIGWEWGGYWSTLKDYQHFSDDGR
ncbi:MAG: M15 family metallopeptidase, partial [Acidimicrobiia bacterium]